MEINVGGRKQAVRETDVATMFGYIQKSGVSLAYKSGSKGGYSTHSEIVSGFEGSSHIDTVFLIDKWWKHDVKMKYGNMRLNDSLSEEMGRTRRLERSINNHIPNKIERLQNEMKELDKKSPQYNRSMKCRKRRIAEEKLKLKEYKFELRYRKRLVYTCSKLLIPAIYILRRVKYNRVQAKWRFMGREQPRIHLGKISDVGHLSDEELKRRAIIHIRKKFYEPLDSLTLKWIKDENNRLNNWCEKMGYKIQRG